MHLDLHLLLGRDAVEATTAGVTLNVDHAEAVAGVLADALEGGEGAGIVDAGLEVLGVGAEDLFILLGLGDDLLELLALVGEDVVAVGEVLLGRCDLGGLGVDLTGVLADAFFGELDLEGLVLDLFREEVKLAVVPYVVELGLVGCDLLLGYLDLVLLLGREGAEFLDLVVVLLDAGVESGDNVFEVTYFLGELTADGADAVDLGEDCLQLVERAETVLYLVSLVDFSLIFGHML